MVVSREGSEVPTTLSSDFVCRVEGDSKATLLFLPFLGAVTVSRSEFFSDSGAVAFSCSGFPRYLSLLVSLLTALLDVSGVGTLS